MRYILTFLFSLSATMLFAQHGDIAPTNEFKVTGMVKRSLTISVKGLSGFRQDTLDKTTLKSSHDKEDDKRVSMKGVKLKTILDSAAIDAPDHKAYGELYIVLTASDGYRNVYSWNELFNTEVGDHVYVITEMDGVPVEKMNDRVLVMSLADIHSGRRHLKALTAVDVRRAP